MLPEFIVIAGPNGAGKSITSKSILKSFGIEAFDWDNEFHLKWKTFDFDPVVMEGIRESANEDFQVHINRAFTDRKSVAYETNFHSNYNFELADQARNLGYRNSLYFLALCDPEIGIRRVADRVQKGGHHVSEPTIRGRFKIGLEMLDNRALVFFDRIFIYDSAKTFSLQIVIEGKKLIFQNARIESKIINRLPYIKSLLN